MPATRRDQPQHARRCNADRGGATFRVWAPEARQVFVLTGGALRAAEQAGFVPSPDDAMVRIGDGSWGAFVADLDEGAAYRFWVVGSGSTGFKRDPRARELSVVPAYPDCDCLVHDPASYPWHDGGFRAPEFRDLILYQLHIGAYYAVDAQGHDKRRGVAKFLDLLDRVDYLRDLGINGVQFLPIQEFPSQTSRGYNGLDLYSPEMDYHVADDGELNRYLVESECAARPREPAAVDARSVAPRAESAPLRDRHPASERHRRVVRPGVQPRRAPASTTSRSSSSTANRTATTIAACISPTRAGWAATYSPTGTRTSASS